MTIQILGGSTSQTVRLFIQDTSKTDGSGLTGLVHNTSGLVAYYSKGATGTATAITFAAQTAGGAWTSGGFVAADGTNMPGVYRLDIPNAALDSEVETIVMLRGAANMAPVLLRVMGGKSQANAVTVADKTGYTLSTAGVNAVADQVWNEAYNQHTTAGTFGRLMNTLRRANTVLEGTVLASPTPTTTVFRLSGIDYPTGALVGSVLWMDSGASREQNSPILSTLNNGDSTVTVTLENALVTAPAAGDTVLIDPTSHVHSVAEIQAGLALQSTLLLVAGYADTEIAAIKVVTDKLNTGLVADGAVFQFTANMLELAPAGGGGGGGNGDATAANQQLILDQLDVIQAKTDLIGTSQALLAGAVLEPGTITSFPETLTVGDSYTVANGRAIQIPIIDSNGNPISEAGTLLFADADVSFIIKRSFDTVASRILTCNASFVDPPGTGTGEGPYALIEIPADQTAKGLLKYQYSGVLKFTWPGTANEVVSFETGTITFDN